MRRGTPALVLALLGALVASPSARAQFFLKGAPGDAMDCQCSLTGDAQVPGRLVVQGDLSVGDELVAMGGVDYPDCPAGYARDVSAFPSHPEIVVCVETASGDEMVKVGTFWIDRYEAVVYSERSCSGTAYGSGVDNWAAIGATFPINGQATVPVYACSTGGVIPTTYLTWFQAQTACTMAGKRLPSNAEWQLAAMGTPGPTVDSNAPGGGPCHAAALATGPRATALAGADPTDPGSCISRFGAEDMAGNVWEWVADWEIGGAWSGAGNGASNTTWSPSPLFGGDITLNVIGAAYTVEFNAYSGGLPAAVIRSGAFNTGIGAGAFGYNIHVGGSEHQAAIGFRCVRSQ